jgi:hypothetical protein
MIACDKKFLSLKTRSKIKKRSLKSIRGQYQIDIHPEGACHFPSKIYLGIAIVKITGWDHHPSVQFLHKAAKDVDAKEVYKEDSICWIVKNPQLPPSVLG